MSAIKNNKNAVIINNLTYVNDLIPQNHETQCEMDKITIKIKEWTLIFRQIAQHLSVKLIQD